MHYPCFIAFSHFIVSLFVRDSLKGRVEICERSKCGLSEVCFHALELLLEMAKFTNQSQSMMQEWGSSDQQPRGSNLAHGVISHQPCWSVNSWCLQVMWANGRGRVQCCWVLNALAKQSPSESRTESSRKCFSSVFPSWCRIIDRRVALLSCHSCPTGCEEINIWPTWPKKMSIARL